MKFKYTGDLYDITLRGVCFEKGKAVDLSDNEPLAEKIAALDYFEQVKRGPKKVKASD